MTQSQFISHAGKGNAKCFYTRTQGVCKPYTGTVCRRQLQGRNVFHNLTFLAGKKKPPPTTATTTTTQTTTAATTNTTDLLPLLLPLQGASSRPPLEGSTHEEILQELVEELQETGLMTTMQGTPDQFCLRPALELMCHHAFPDCLVEGEKEEEEEEGGGGGDAVAVVPLPICREHCLAVKELYCVRQWIEIEAKKKEDVYFKARGHFRLPDCDSLPSLWHSHTPCTHSDVHQPLVVEEVSDHCYKNRGRWYNGTVNMTASGLICQAWADNFPQQHERSPLVFPELVGAENFCRNPGSEEERPWCYTTVLEKRWEFCDISKCVGDATSQTGSEEEGQIKFSLVAIIIISIVSAAGVIIIAFFITITIVLIRRRISGGPLEYKSTVEDDVDAAIAQLPENAAYHQMKTATRLNPKLEGYEFPRNDIVFLRDIGQGAFGRVFKARIPASAATSGRFKPGESTLIAVKMLKEDASEDLQIDFEREASLMADFDHPNIVRLLGVCAMGKPMCLLFEYMSKGDLNDFLRLCSPDHYNLRLSRSQNHVVDLEDGLRVEVEPPPAEKDGRGGGEEEDERDDSPARLSTKEQLSVAQQVAAGMAYLAQRDYVHRDLATRNCLVTHNMAVKISDFGLARSVHSVEYYRGSEQDAIPIRWMPLEAILYNKFSTQSDVWSFGVVLWEIFAFALQPYYGLTHEEVVHYVKAGKVLEQPDRTPPAVYELMKDCWHRRPTDRPSFHTLYKTLGSMCENYAPEKKAGVNLKEVV
ncbi:hypothetical protein ACOMHN_003437 [Nucella lapillus]